MTDKDPEDYTPESGRRADPQNVIARITRELKKVDVHIDGTEWNHGMDWNNREQRNYVRHKFADNGGGEIDEAILPGFGPEGFAETAEDDCGDPYPFGCDECGHHVDFGRTCGRSICSRCAIAWNRDAAIGKAAKVRRLRKEKDWNTPDEEHQKIHHQIISPPLRWWADLADAGLSLEEAREITKDVVKYILDEQRAQGVVVMHSYRGEKEDGSLTSDPDATDMGEWKDRIYSEKDWWGDVRDELAWQPHYHCVVVSDHVATAGFTDVIEPATGWVIHRIIDEEGISLEEDGDMAKAICYCLSHANIRVNKNRNNSSDIWEVGAFKGEIFKSSGEFTAKPTDQAWADSKVREWAEYVLGLNSTGSDCGAEIPAVDDPDELARRIIRELYPDEDDPDVEPDHVLAHVAEGNIRVDVETTSGGGGSVSVRDAWGNPVGSDGWGGDLPDAPGGVVVDGSDEAVDPIVTESDDLDVDDEEDDTCGCGGHECDGTLRPLPEIRQSGILDDPEWRQRAPHAHELIEADREWPDDLDRWRASEATAAIGVGHAD